MVRGGLKALEQFMTAQKSRYNQAPVVLVTGFPFVAKPSDRKPHNDHIETAAKQVEFLLRQKLRLQTVTADAGYSTFPTVHKCQEALALADRVGATTIVATGTGVAVDIAKAVAAFSKNVNQLILCPTTLGGALASTSSHPLLLDPEEEALVVGNEQQLESAVRDGEKKHVETVVNQWDNASTVMDETYKQNAILAAVTIALDCINRDVGGATGPARAVLEKATQLLGNMEAAEFVELSELCHLAGALLSFGLSADSNETRSLPVALVSALCPTTDWGQFPTMTLWAALAPTLRETVSHRFPEMERILPNLPPAPTLVTNESLDELLSHLQANQALWNCYDCSDEEFRDILRPHVLIDQ